MSTGDYAKSIASFAERSRSVNVRNLSTGDTIVVRQLNSARISFGRVFAPYATRGLSTPCGLQSLPAAAVLRAGLRESTPASWYRQIPDALGKVGPLACGAAPLRNAADDVFGTDTTQECCG